MPYLVPMTGCSFVFAHRCCADVVPGLGLQVLVLLDRHKDQTLEAVTQFLHPGSDAYGNFDINLGHFLRGPRPSMKPHTRHGMSLTYSAHAFWLLVGACNPMLCPNWGCRDPSLRELLPHLQNRYRVELGQGLGMTGTATSTFPPLFYPSFFSPPLLSPSFFFLVLFPPTTWVELTLEL